MKSVRAKFFNLQTGLFSMCTYGGPSDHVAANTPQGSFALLAPIDELSQRIDIDKMNAIFASKKAARIKVGEESLVAADVKSADVELPELPWDDEKEMHAAALAAMVDYQPPQPSADHVWNVETKRWALSDAARVSMQADSSARGAIAKLEQKQARAVRELLLDASNTDSRDRLAQIDAEIASLRASLKK